MDQSKSWAEAVAIKNEKIVFVGTKNEAMLWKGSSTRLINNPDGMLLPGFIDTHVHLLSGGIEMSQCYLNELGSPEDIFEVIKDYLNRISNSRIKNSKNFSGWDLSIKGSKEFNDLYITDPDVYYFSYSNYSTKELKNGTHFPEWNMSLLSWIPSIIIGRSDQLSPDWYMNDGIVSTISMKYPVNSKNVSAPNKLYDDKYIEKGVWQVMSPVHQDHHHIIGHKIGYLDSDNMKLFFSDICKRLYNLN